MAPALDLYNPQDDAEEAARIIPHAHFVRLPAALGHAAAAAGTPDDSLIDAEIKAIMQRYR